MTETVSGVAFVVLALALIVGAVGMLSSKNVMHSAYWLLELSIAAAGVYFLAGADYLALVQLLVYAGAVSVLVIFTIMITARSRDKAERPRDFSWLAAIACVLFCVILVIGIVELPLSAADMPASAPDLLAFGQLLFSPDGWALPFEISCVVLTVALVGAIWWSGKGGE